MPLNLLKKYNDLLDISSLSVSQRNLSLRKVFDRDISNNPNFKLQGKKINPTPIDGEIKMELLYSHLTTKTINRENKREFDHKRSVRLHWIRHHTEEKSRNNILIFSTLEGRDYRTYVYDKVERYVIVLEPLRKANEYYLLTAYKLEGKDLHRDKIMKKYNKTRLNEVL